MSTPVPPVTAALGPARDLATHCAPWPLTGGSGVRETLLKNRPQGPPRGWSEQSLVTDRGLGVRKRRGVG